MKGSSCSFMPQKVHKTCDFPILAHMTAIPPKNHATQIRDHLVRAQLIHAQQVGHRLLLVLSGTEAWCERARLAAGRCFADGRGDRAGAVVASGGLHRRRRSPRVMISIVALRELLRLIV